MTMIRVTCPACHTQYLIVPTLRGQRMQCPECREVFTVNGDAEWLPEYPSGDGPEAGPSGSVDQSAS